MTKKQKKMLARILAAAALMVLLHFVPVGGLPALVCYLAPYLLVGWETLVKAAKGIRNR